MNTVLLTGDNDRVARRGAAEVGIDTVIADVLPEDRLAVISRLQEDGKTVAMVGDGVKSSSSATACGYAPSSPPAEPAGAPH